MTHGIGWWIEQAERSLFVLANELRSVRLEPSTKHLHLRALALKREVARWFAEPPDERTRAETLESIQTLVGEARTARRAYERPARWPAAPRRSSLRHFAPRMRAQ